MKNENKDLSWQSAWLEELDKSAPPLADFVKDEPLPRVEPIKASTRVADILTVLSSKRYIAAIAACFMLVMAVTVAIIMGSGDPTEPPSPVGAPSVIALEINPSVLLRVDENGMVGSVVALNSDADAVMALPNFEGRVIGKPLDEAISEYADMCARLGFINYSGDAVRVSGIDGDERLEVASSALTDYFKSKGILAVVDSKGEDEESFCESFGITVGDLTLTDAVSAMIASYAERDAESRSDDELREKYESEIVNVELDNYIKEAFEEQLEGLDEPWRSIIEGIIDMLVNGELSGNRDHVLEAYRHLFEDDDERIEGLTVIPESAEEYKEKMKEYVRFRSENLEKSNESEYGKDRDRIADEEYNGFVRELIDRYGSVGAYFESLK